jgi:hypothetical protein
MPNKAAAERSKARRSTGKILGRPETDRYSRDATGSGPRTQPRACTRAEARATARAGPRAGSPEPPRADAARHPPHPPLPPPSNVAGARREPPQASQQAAKPWASGSAAAAMRSRAPVRTRDGTPRRVDGEAWGRRRRGTR